MKLVVWNKGGNDLYYRLIRGNYKNYYVGMTNQYGHEVLFIIPNIYHYVPKLSFKERFKKRAMRFLKNM